MPFKSEAQRRYLHANEPEIADRWESEMKQKHSNPYGNNARNFGEGSTDRDLWEDSAIPFVSATPEGLPQGFNGPTDHVTVATQDTAVFIDPDGGVHTRFKYGPADVGGDVGINGGTP